MSTLQCTRIDTADGLAWFGRQGSLDPAIAFRPMLARLEAVWNPAPDMPEENPRTILRALWLCAAGTPRSCELAATCDLPLLSEDQSARLKALVLLKEQGVPLAHLVQRQRFMGLELLAGPEALIPRKETEILARAAIEEIQGVVNRQGHAAVIDICTGCGNLALAFAAHIPQCSVVAADICELAVGLARRNARHLRLQDRVEFRVGDLFTPFETPQLLGQADVVTCNPPYISSAKVGKMRREISSYEPTLAFDGGPLGVTILLRTIAQAPRYLKPGGHLGFEVGLGQGPAAARFLARTGVFTDIQTFNDAAGQIRCLFARLAV